jgi:two-component system response regulator FlrC
MRSIVPSAAVLRQKYALVSALRAQGFAIGTCEDGKPGAQDLFLVADGEVPPASARTLILGEGARIAVPSHNGNPARLSYGSEDAAIGAGFASAMARGPWEPVAADPGSLA